METLIKLTFAFVWTWLVHIQAAPRRARLTIAETPSYFYSNIGGDSNVYSFGYDVSDLATGNTQYRTEDRYANGTVVGAYGYVDALGALQRFRYIADERGYRVSNEVPQKPFVVTEMAYTTESPKNKPVESSITWSRPKRPNKNKTEINLNNNVPNYEKLPNRIINVNNPPSYYAIRD